MFTRVYDKLTRRHYLLYSDMQAVRRIDDRVIQCTDNAYLAFSTFGTCAYCHVWT